MDKSGLENLEVYCRYDDCTDQVFGPDNKPRPVKRRMQFTGFSAWGVAIYMCPVCNREKRFKERTFGTGYTET